MALVSSDLTFKATTANFFWMGDFSIYEMANINSFIKNGFDVNIWTYDKNFKVFSNNNKINIKNASEILDEELLYKFKQGNQKSNMSSFTNIFRLELLKKVGGWWFDLDCICNKPVSSFVDLVKEKPFVIGRERDDYSGSSVMYFTDIEVLQTLLDKTWKKINEKDFEFIWGEIGPDLISEIFLDLDLMKLTLEEKYFFKVSAEDFYKFFLNNTENLIALEETLYDSYVIHTWNEMFKRSLISKKKLPPRGSFLFNHISNNVLIEKQKSYGWLLKYRFNKYIYFFIKIIFRIKIISNNLSNNN